MPHDGAPLGVGAPHEAGPAEGVGATATAAGAMGLFSAMRDKSDPPPPPVLLLVLPTLEDDPDPPREEK